MKSLIIPTLWHSKQHERKLYSPSIILRNINVICTVTRDSRIIRSHVFHKLRVTHALSDHGFSTNSAWLTRYLTVPHIRFLISLSSRLYITSSPAGWNSYIYSPFTFTCGIDTNKPGSHSYYFLVYLTVVLPGPLIISTVCYSYILFYLRLVEGVASSGEEEGSAGDPQV